MYQHTTDVSFISKSYVLAKPKSASLICSSAETSKFCGFKSRWMMRCVCRKSTPVINSLANFYYVQYQIFRLYYYGCDLWTPINTDVVRWKRYYVSTWIVFRDIPRSPTRFKYPAKSSSKCSNTKNNTNWRSRSNCPWHTSNNLKTTSKPHNVNIRYWTNWTP